MARYTKTQLEALRNAVLDIRGPWDQFNAGAAGQLAFLNALSSEDRSKVIRAALKIANYQEPNEKHRQLLHDAIVDYYAENPNDLPDLAKLSRNFAVKAYDKLPEQGDAVGRYVKTNKGTVKNLVKSLYRYIRGVGKLNEGKDLVTHGNMRGYDGNITTALTKLAKAGFIHYDPQSGAMVIPRNTIRAIDPYYERYNETLHAFKNAIDGYIEILANQPEQYNDQIKAFAQHRIRGLLPRIPVDTPAEERDRMLAEQAGALQTITDGDMASAHNALIAQLRNLKSDPKLFNKMTSIFSEKGLRGLMTNPKAAMKIAQITEYLEDHWRDITQEGTQHTVWDYVMPNDELPQVTRSAGPWKSTELDSINKFDEMKRNIETAEQRYEQSRMRAQNIIAAFHAAHPELVAQQQQQQRLMSNGIPYKRTPEDDEEDQLLQNIGGRGYANKAKAILANPRLVELGDRPYQYPKSVLDLVTSDNENSWRLAKNRNDLYQRSANHDICVGLPQMNYHDGIRKRKKLILFNGPHEDLESATAEIYLDTDEKGVITNATVSQVNTASNARYTGDRSVLDQLAKDLVGKNLMDVNNVTEAEGIEYKEQGDQGVPQIEAPQEDVDVPNMHYQRYIDEYALDNEQDPADADEYAAEQMRQEGYRQDDDGNWLAPDDPRYNDYDEYGNRIVDDEDIEDGEEDPGYVEGGYVDNLGNRQLEQFLSWIIDDGISKPHKAAVAAVTRRY